MSVIIVIVLSIRVVLIRVIKGKITHHETSRLKLILDEKEEELKSTVLCF